MSASAYRIAFLAKCLVTAVVALWLGYGLVMLAACSNVVEEIEPGVEDVVGIAEEYCRANPTLPCGKVYQCDTPAENAIGFIEICIPQFIDVSLAEAQYGTCKLSTDKRFEDANLCWWCCGEGCTRGCNSYNGCFCPVFEMPPDAGVDAPAP